ncbi:MAG: glycosyl transferase [Candidatus Omnitrophota bacterium]|nr:MAG: glycosyl transferase [Candidatus Omnitrophota bacterium]
MIACIVFLSGSIVMSFEILGSRVLAPYFGNTVFVWGSLISVFLSGLTMGYWIGGKLADWKASYALFAGLLAIPGVMLCLFPLYSDVINDWVFDRQFEMRIEALIASLFLFFIPSIFLGAVSPYAIKLRVHDLAWLGTGVGNLYAISSLGSIFGTLLTTFYLITEIGVKKIIVWEGVILLLAAACLWIVDAKSVRMAIPVSPSAETPTDPVVD